MGTKDLAKEMVGCFIRLSGVAWFIRNVRRYRVCIVLYHNPPADVFRKHMAYLRRHYNVIHLDSLVSAIRARNWSSIPDKALVVTIDDGFRENFSLLDVCKEYGIRPTIYLCSHIVDTNRKFWFEAGYSRFQDLKRRRHEDRLDTLRRKIGFHQSQEYAQRQALSLDELRAMSPHVDFQSHGMYHAVLTTLEDKAVREDVEESRRHLEDLLKTRICHYSYPNGDYNDRCIQHLKESRYRSARTIDIGWNGPFSDPFRLKAMGIQDDASVNVLCGQISGIFGYFRYLRHGSINGAHPPFL